MRYHLLFSVYLVLLSGQAAASPYDFILMGDMDGSGSVDSADLPSYLDCAKGLAICPPGSDMGGLPPKTVTANDVSRFVNGLGDSNLWTLPPGGHFILISAKSNNPAIGSGLYGVHIENFLTSAHGSSGLHSLRGELEIHASIQSDQTGGASVPPGALPISGNVVAPALQLASGEATTNVLCGPSAGQIVVRFYAKASLDKTGFGIDQEVCAGNVPCVGPDHLDYWDVAVSCADPYAKYAKTVQGDAGGLPENTLNAADLAIWIDMLNGSNKAIAVPGLDLGGLPSGVITSSDLSLLSFAVNGLSFAEFPLRLGCNPVAPLKCSHVLDFADLSPDHSLSAGAGTPVSGKVKSVASIAKGGSLSFSGTRGSMALMLDVSGGACTFADGATAVASCPAPFSDQKCAGLLPGPAVSNPLRAEATFGFFATCTAGSVLSVFHPYTTKRRMDAYFDDLDPEAAYKYTEQGRDLHNWVWDAPACGNGIVESFELCDDGPGEGEGLCLDNCEAIQRCGDGFAAGTEICDDGNNRECSGPCASDCQSYYGGCGDGSVCGLEECEPGPSLASGLAARDKKGMQKKDKIVPYMIPMGIERVKMDARNALSMKGSVPVILTLVPDDAVQNAKSVEERMAACRAMTEQFLARLSPDEFKLRGSYDLFPGVYGDLSLKGLARLEHRDDVLSIRTDKQVQTDIFESIPLIGAEAVHDQGVSGNGTAVAVLDTGVVQHPYLQDHIADEQCFLATGCPLGGTESGGPGAALDGYGHGTHVSGIAVGNYPGTEGVAPGSGLVAVKVVGDDGYASFSDIIKGLDWVALQQHVYNVRAVNMSLGTALTYDGPCDAVFPELSFAIQSLSMLDVVVVAASGNGGVKNGISAPGCIDAAVSVGATHSNVEGRLSLSICSEVLTVDKVACFSNGSPSLDLLAPGAVIWSSVAGSLQYSSRCNGEPTCALSGTSMAAPHVAGLASLIAQENPSLAAFDIVSLMKASGVPIVDSRNGVSTARIDAAKAVATAGVGGGVCQPGCSLSCLTGYHKVNGECVPLCGDDIAVQGEACDGTDLGRCLAGYSCDDACASCVRICGNGALDAGEFCDDANLTDCDGCNDGPGGSCSATSGCGDGVVCGSELCDDGNNGNQSDSCLDGCIIPVCGDGYVWNSDGGVEECDDGAANSDTEADACRSDCTLAGCLDGVVDSMETCDDFPHSYALVSAAPVSGFDVKVDNGIAFIPYYDQLVVYDVAALVVLSVTTIPPCIAGTYPFVSSVALAGSHAYLAEEDACGLIVLDISKLTSPYVIAHVKPSMPPFASSPIRVAVNSNIAVLTLYDTGLAVFDISNPLNPVEIGFYDNTGPGRYTYGARMAGDLVYMVGGNGLYGPGYLKILDLTQDNPAQPGSLDPVMLGEVIYPGWGSDVAIGGGHAYVAAGHRLFFFNGVASLQGTVAVLDVSNPSLPGYIQNIDLGENEFATGIRIRGSRGYVSLLKRGLAVIDLNSGNPLILGFASYFENSAYAVDVWNNYAVVPTEERGGSALPFMGIYNIDENGLCLTNCNGYQVCGNGSMEGAEACDDGNTANGDGCNGICTGP